MVNADLERNQAAEVRILEESETAALEQNQATEVQTLDETVVADEHGVQALPAAIAVFAHRRSVEPDAIGSRKTAVAAHWQTKISQRHAEKSIQ